MSYRLTPLITGETYHIFNRSIARQPIFNTKVDYLRGVETLKFYCYTKPGLRFSYYKRLPTEQRTSFWNNLQQNGQKQVQLLAFCLMPNHVHFMIKEIVPNGISTFMSNFQNSYAKYFNIKTKRSGSLFQSMFKVVRIESDEQLMHVARYIHLNPLTSFVLRKIDELENYPWSSYSYYINNQNSKVFETKLLLNYFSSIGTFKQFTKDQVDYQRTMDQIKHLALE